MDFGTGTFLAKLHTQLTGASDDALLLAAEMLTLHALPLSNVSSATKTARVQTVVGWMSEPVELPVEVIEAFKQGRWNGGVGSNIQIWRALANLVDVAVKWNSAEGATREQAMVDPWVWRDFLSTVPDLIPSQREALLYLAFPEHFLPIVNTEHKQRILDAFEDELPESTGDVDRDLFAITMALQSEAEARVDYYESPYVEQWWPAAAEPTQRAWLIRGSSVHGKNLVPTWLDEGWTSLWLGFLDPIDPGAPLTEVRAAIDDGYAGRSAAYRRQKAEDTFEFLSRMKAGDLVVTTSEGNLYIGEVQGEAVWSLDENLPARLRRPVVWHNASSPLAYEELPAPLPDRLTSQEDVTDLTDDLAIIESLLSVDVIHTSDDVSEAATELQPLRLRPPDDELAETLLVPKTWLDKLVRVLDDRHQVILYGPPGTGKTYLANKVARFLTNNPGDARLVQFHPSYSYEDFFEGYRPVKGPEGHVAFELKAGPFRRIVEAARDNPTTPYVLIIDEINRANLAKVFGELYFLLEYRDQAIDLLYAEEGTEQFRLPRNVFVIGTMNTADRSIALVDSAMRRRFGFLSLHPDEPHVKGMLRAWLAKHDLTDEPARLLEELNNQIVDADFRVGPSYLMRESVHERDDGIDEVWETSILPLLAEHHVGDGTDIDRRYGLAALRKRIASVAAVIAEDSEPSLPEMGATTDGDGEPDDA